MAGHTPFQKLRDRMTPAERKRGAAKAAKMRAKIVRKKRARTAKADAESETSKRNKKTVFEGIMMGLKEALA